MPCGYPTTCDKPPASPLIARALIFTGRHGRWCLVLGLIAGLSLPGVAQALVPWLPEMIAALLFLNALRIGPRAVVGTVSEAGDSIRVVLIYQLVAPLVVLGVLLAFGVAGTAPALAIVLVLSAPSVTGAPNFTVMLGHDPARPMRLLLIGTALFPLTVIPILIAIPSVETFTDVLVAALRLMAVIGVAVGAAFLVRLMLWRTLGDEGRGAIDGASAILLTIVVIALMAAGGPTLRSEPQVFFGWLAFALILNFSLQTLSYVFLHKQRAEGVGASIIAGNRNIALFLVALSPEITTPLLLFIACYQVPMYLTPLLMRRVYRAEQSGQVR